MTTTSPTTSDKTALKIIILVPPASGHVNPVCSLASELCSRDTVEVVIYSDDDYRAIVEQSGCQFRRYSQLTFSRMMAQMNETTTNRFAFMLHSMVTFTSDLLPQLVDDVETMQPDLIIYDGFFVPAKYLLKVLEQRLSKGTSRLQRMPKSAMFVPNFAINEKIARMFGENSPVDFRMPFSLLYVFLRNIKLALSFSISAYNPLKVFMEKNPNINIVGVMPELQLFYDEFDTTYKFIGSCIAEKSRVHELTKDDQLKSVLDECQANKSLKLVYMSLGTVFNANLFIFECVIEAFRNTNDRFRVVMSMGDTCFNVMKDKPSSVNILMRARVPQLDVLKSTSVFISHCGMNSINEAIRYAVPVVGIPMDGDQPVVARRVCGELEMGVRLSAAELTPQIVRDAVEKVLTDEKYVRNVQELSRVASKYDGPKLGAQIVMNYLKS